LLGIPTALSGDTATTVQSRIHSPTHNTIVSGSPQWIDISFHAEQLHSKHAE
jgi:hypothetical protein